MAPLIDPDDVPPPGDVPDVEPAEPVALALPRSTSVNAYIAPPIDERLVVVLPPGIVVAPSQGLTHPVNVTLEPRACELPLCVVGFCAAATERPANVSPTQTAGMVRVIACTSLANDVRSRVRRC